MDYTELLKLIEQHVPADVQNPTVSLNARKDATGWKIDLQVGLWPRTHYINAKTVKGLIAKLKAEGSEDPKAVCEIKSVSLPEPTKPDSK